MHVNIITVKSKNEAYTKLSVFKSLLRNLLDIVGQDPSDSKSNRLHVDIFRFCFIHFRYIPQIPLKWSVLLLRSWTSTGYISNSTGSSVTNRPVLPKQVVQKHPSYKSQPMKVSTVIWTIKWMVVTVFRQYWTVELREIKPIHFCLLSNLGRLVRFVPY